MDVQKWTNQRRLFMKFLFFFFFFFFNDFKRPKRPMRIEGANFSIAFELISLNWLIEATDAVEE